MKTIRIGSGAGYAGDRLEPSLELIEKGQLDYISYECLAERTIAIGQQAKLKDPTKGYNGLLEHRMEKALPLCWAHKVKLITNMGSANPQAAAKKCVEIAQKHGLTGMKIACVTGDDLLPVIDKYMDTEVWDKLGKGTMVGHLLECGGQATGGYFAEPGKKDVPGVGHLGFPIVEIAEDGSFFVTKVPEAGGMVTVETCSEQIVYEIHDPENYFTPDVVADFKQVKFTQVEKDVVKVEGATGKPKTETFKCSIGYRDCFIGDGEISYGGPGCVARAKLALEILKERLELVAPNVFDELKFDILGCNSLYWNPDYKYSEEPSEVRVRVAGRAKTKAEADIIANEVEALYTNGPAGGCGAVKRTRDIVSVASILVSRYDVHPEVELFTV